ncbi:hypothetical protein AB0F81_45690 [Actinoplanes sp. NPDC024001]|uniref:hypothetical protein n=1 Tax=Actinoplanes sp. NPDC024001 TaxID=3154598 RepID=UPI0034007C9B
MMRIQELTEVELRLLLAVEATRGERDDLVDELRSGGLAKLQSRDAKRGLGQLQGRGLIRLSEDRNYHVLTDNGRQACREKLRTLGELIEYGRKTLR